MLRYCFYSPLRLFCTDMQSTISITGYQKLSSIYRLTNLTDRRAFYNCYIAYNPVPLRIYTLHTATLFQSVFR